MKTSAISRMCQSYPYPCTTKTRWQLGPSTWERRTYIVKPFSPTELAVRIQAALRRRPWGRLRRRSLTLRGDLVVDYVESSASVAAVQSG